MDAKIKDVAQFAGVSISTVSNTLSGRKPVSPEKKAAVMEAVRRLGYVPNINARLLKSRRTGNIGLFLPYIDGPFYTTLLQEVYHACAESGYAMIMHVDWDADSQSVAANIQACNIDAAIVLNDRLRDEDASTLVKRSLPLVFMDREISLPGVGSITLDNRTGTEQQVAYLAHTGHKRISYLRGPDNHDGSERFDAFRQAMEAAQLPVDDALVMDGQFARKVAYNCVYYMMRSQRDNPPDAILCANDEMALGCLDALNDLGYTVPRDVSVLGFDDMGTENCTPPLTTVSYSMRDFARMAVEEAIRLIGDPQSNGLSQTLKTELRLRNSVSFRYGDIPDLK